MKVERRGRPKSQPTNPEDQPRKFVIKTGPDSEGITTTRTYDLDIFPNGPIITEFDYPKNYRPIWEIRDERNAKLPLKYREYIHPSNGKIIGYGRAKALGLI